MRAITVCVSRLARASLLVPLTFASAALADEPSKVQLHTASLPAPASVMGPSDRSTRDLRDGCLIPHQELQVGPRRKEATLRLGGAKVQIIWTAPANLSIKSGDAPAIKLEISRAGTGLAPATVPLDATRSYILAFPFATVAKTPGRTDSTATILYRAGGVQQGTIDGQAITLYDDNTDGFYTFVKDGYRIGPIADDATAAGIVFSPFARHFTTGKAIYEFRGVARDASELSYQPYTGPTASLSVNFAAPDLTAELAMRSSDGELNLVVPAGNATAMLVTPGAYELSYGTAYSSKLKRIVAIVVPSRTTSVSVPAGQAATMNLGAPFTLDYRVSYKNNTISIDPNTLHLRGRADEEYVAIKHLTEPAVSLVTGGKKIPLGKMGFS